MVRFDVASKNISKYFESLFSYCIHSSEKVHMFDAGSIIATARPTEQEKHTQQKYDTQIEFEGVNVSRADDLCLSILYE